MPISSLYRLDDTTWSTTIEPLQGGIGEIRITTPPFDTGAKAYRLASIIRDLIQEKLPHIDRATLERGFVVTNASGPLKGTWFVSSRKNESAVSMVFHRAVTAIAQWIPFTRTISSEKIVTLYAQELPDCSPRKFVGKMVCAVQLAAPPEQEAAFVLPPPLPTRVEELLSIPLFQDQYTLLATTSLQKEERNFVMEADHRGQRRYVIKQGVLLLAKVGASTPEACAENRMAWASYRRFLELEFGKEFVDYIRVAYNIDFAEMEEKGLPLYPDHVFKCNIGANNIELGHVERLWDVMKDLAQQPLLPPERYAEQLSLRVLRKLLPRCGSIDHLQEYLKQFVGEYGSLSVRDLPSDRFNDIVALFWPTEEELHNSFSGRKIRHLAIEGYPTMGNPNVPNPCRDLFELLHVFHDLSCLRDPHDYYELLAHVVSKKNLFRQTPSQHNTWHVGILVPGPSADGSRVFYVNNFFFDCDGNVHYWLEPACKTYRTSTGSCPPEVLLLRSTAMNRNAVSWFNSIRADLNYGSPCMFNPDRAYPSEKKFFEDRTIPVWVGLLLLAEKKLGFPILLEQAASAFSRYIHEKAPKDEAAILFTVQHLLAQKKYDELKRYLFQSAEKFKERVEDKIQQPIVVAGHSLGAAIGQFLIDYFFALHQRLPLPGLDVNCYFYDGPAIKRANARGFEQYCRTYKDVLEAQGSFFNVFHQFELGDIVPEFGGEHLRTVPQDHFSARIFTPLKEADALSIRTPPTHGRRTGTAEIGKDFTVTDLKAEDVSSFDNSVLLNWRLREIFGYRFLLSPKISEATRKIFAGMLYVPFRALERFIDYKPPNPDKKGVVTLEYGVPSEPIEGIP